MGKDRKEYMKEYYQKYKEANRERLKAKKHAWYLENHERVKEYNKNYDTEVTREKRKSKESVE